MIAACTLAAAVTHFAGRARGRPARHDAQTAAISKLPNSGSPFGAACAEALGRHQAAASNINYYRSIFECFGIIKTAARSPTGTLVKPGPGPTFQNIGSPPVQLYAVHVSCIRQ